MAHRGNQKLSQLHVGKGTFPELIVIALADSAAFVYLHLSRQRIQTYPLSPKEGSRI